MTLRKVLLADDQRDVLVALELLLSSEGFETRSATSPNEVLRALEEDRFDAILMDLNYSRDTTSGEEGLDLLTRIASNDQAPPVLVMTAWGSMELAVAAMRQGARDFVLKPWDNEALIASIERHARVPEPVPRYSHNELEVAAQVQRKLWPQGRRELPGFVVHGFSQPVGAVGGDTYDFISVGDDRLAFALADVSGKGLPAALLMASLQAILRSGVQQGDGDLKSLIRVANRHFFEASELQHYATLFFALYDEMTSRLRYVSCGHPPALLFAADGSVTKLEATSTAFGMFDEIDVGLREARLTPGDSLVVYSDGVVEAESDAGAELGEEGLKALVGETGLVGKDDAARNVVERVIASHPRQSDDMTVVVAQSRRRESGATSTGGFSSHVA